MKESFLTNYSNYTFLQRLRDCFNKCSSFSLTVSFIKEAGLKLIQKEIENALNRGVKGRITQLCKNVQSFLILNYIYDPRIRSAQKK